MKIAITRDNSGWIIDNIVKDFKNNSRHQIVDIRDNPDCVWMCNFWGFKNDYPSVPKNAMSLFQLHHIETTKIDEYDFKMLNQADGCLVYNKKTEKQANEYLDIPVYRVPYWVLSQRTVESDQDKVLKLKNEISAGDELLIGSFQKDSVYDGDRPKLCKGPDVFLDIVTKLHSSMKIKVVLGGYSRKYLMKNFEQRGIPYVYLEKYQDINSLYDCLDWYLVTSRIEGGPQAVLETAYRKIKVLSTDVGVAPEILHPDCICGDVETFVQKITDNIDRRDENYINIFKNHMVETVVPIWDDFFSKLIEEK